MQITFERKVVLMDSSLRDAAKLTSDTIFVFLNEAIDKFYKTRYSGTNIKGEGFEQSQKRIDDLRFLIKTIKYTTDIKNNGNIYSVTLPQDYAIMLGDTVGIGPSNDQTAHCWKTNSNGEYVIKYNDTIEVTVETLDKQLNNSLSEHNLKYCNAKPLKHIKGNEINLYTDGKYKVIEYHLTYLSKPILLDPKHISDTPYTGLPEHTHTEIVNIAVQLYLSTRPMQNYSVYSTEVNQME